MKQILFKISAGVTVLWVCLCSGCQPDAEPRNSKVRSRSALTVDTVIARQANSFTTQRSFTGLVKARQSGDIGFTQSGRVKRILVEAGDSVEVGQPIAELDLQRLELKKKNLEDALQRARGSPSGDEPEEAEPSAEEIRQSIRQLREQLNQLETELFARPREPADPAAPSRPFSERVNEIEMRVAALARAARREQASLIADLEAQIQDLDQQLAEGTLAAPYAGTVTLRHVGTGAVVSAGMPIVRLVEQGALEVWVGIPTPFAAEMAIDQQVVVRAHDENYAAVLQAKLPELDQTTRTRTVILRVDGANAATLLPGDVVQVQLSWTDDVAGYWLPMSSLNRGVGDPWSVFVVEGPPGTQVVARRHVELIHHEEKQVYVRGNLVDGDLVIADGTHRIVPQQRVISRNISRDVSSNASREPTS